MNPTADPRPFIHHLLLATAWARYKSRTGTASDLQVARIMQRLSAEVLHRMLSQRNALPPECR